MRLNPIYSDWLSLGADVGGEPVEDPAALAQAELDVRSVDPMSANLPELAEWAMVMQPARIGGLLVNPGANAFLITNPLDAANIRYVWDPYPPQIMPMYRPGDGAIDRPFTLHVHIDDAADATSLLEAIGVVTGEWSAYSGPVTPDRDPDAETFRKLRVYTLAAIYASSAVPLLLLYPIYILLRGLRHMLRLAGFVH